MVVVASAVLLLSGCAGGKEAKDAGAASGAASAGTASSGSSSSGSGSSLGSSGSSSSSGSGGSASTTPTQPIVQQQKQPITGKNQGEVVLAVTAVQVRGKLATVGLIFTPTLP